MNGFILLLVQDLKFVSQLDGCLWADLERLSTNTVVLYSLGFVNKLKMVLRSF